MAEPAELPIWDENDTNTIAVTDALKDDGFPLKTKAPSGIFNSWKRNVYKWIEWLREKIDNEVFKLSEFDGDISAAVSFVSSNGGQLIIDQALDLGTVTVNCLGVTLVWRAEDNLISNGTLNISNCLISTDGGRFPIFSSDLLFTGEPLITEIFPEWFNGASDGESFQLAVDMVTNSPIPISLTASGEYDIDQNVILGNTVIRGNNATVNCLMSDGFTITVPEVVNGVFVLNTDAEQTTPSTTSITNLRISNINFTATRDAIAGTSRAYVIRLGNVDGGLIENCRFITTSTQPLERISAFIDGHHGINNVTIDRCWMEYLNTADVGGCVWIRGYSNVVGMNIANTNITISNCYMLSYAKDENLAISVRDTSYLDNCKVDKCTLVNKYTLGNPNILSVFCTDAANTISNVYVGNCSFEIDNVSTKCVKVAGDGVVRNNVLFDSTITLGIYSGTQFIVDNWTIVDNVSVYVNNVTSQDAIFYAFTACDQIKNCSVTIEAATLATLITNGFRFFAAFDCGIIHGFSGSGIFSTIDTVESSDIIDSVESADIILSDVSKILDNKIEITNASCKIASGSYPTSTFLEIRGNEIIDTNAATGQLFGIDDVTSSTITSIYIDDNKYKGGKLTFGNPDASMAAMPRSFNNNVINIDAGTLLYDSNHCARTTNPWTLFGSGAEFMPIGHNVYVLTPTTGDPIGYTKIANPGSGSGDWIAMPTYP